MGEESQDNEKIKNLDHSIFGTEGISDIRKWREIIDKAQGESDYELCGLKEGPNGELIGIFRKKKL